MDDLEGAAAEAVEEGRGLAAQAEEALRVVEAAAETVTQAAETVQDEWERFGRAASDLIARIAPDQARLASLTQEALEALGALGNGIEELRGEVEADVQEGAAAVRGLGEQADALTPAATAAGEQLEQALEALTEQATTLAGSIGEAVEGAHRFLAEDVPAAVEVMVDDLHQAGEALRAFIDETASGLDEAFTTWEAGLTEAEGAIEGLFAQLDDGLPRSVDEAVKRATAWYDEAWLPLLERADRVEQELAALAAGIEQAGEQGADGAAGLAEELQAGSAALESAHTRLWEVRTLLASYTFVSA
jgi:hypothetical protein